MSRATHSPGIFTAPSSSVFDSTANSLGSALGGPTHYVPPELPKEHVEGTKSAPHPVFINMEKSQYNLMFDIAVDRFRSLKDAVYTIMECRLEINEVDEEFYDMYVPEAEDVPSEYKGRCLVVKTPGRTANHRFEDSFHLGLEADEGRESTKKVWQEMSLDSRSDDFFEWYILIFPEDMRFDNFRLSGHDSIVKKDLCRTQFSPDDVEFMLDDEQNNCSIVWTIVMGRGRSLRPTSSASKKKRYKRGTTAAPLMEE